jgi:hypothetical protein
MESNNNLIIYELEQQVRETFCLSKNIRLFSNMKKVNKSMYIKNFDKFQLVFKNIDKQFSMCEMIERKYEITVRDKSFNFIGRIFNGWNINGFEDYVGTCVRNRKNNFISISQMTDLIHTETYLFMELQKKLKECILVIQKEEAQNILSL